VIGVPWIAVGLWALAAAPGLRAGAEPEAATA
jgi:hypothetical protein